MKIVLNILTVIGALSILASLITINCFAIYYCAVLDQSTPNWSMAYMTSLVTLFVYSATLFAAYKQS